MIERDTACNTEGATLSTMEAVGFQTVGDDGDLFMSDVLSGMETEVKYFSTNSSEWLETDQSGHDSPDYVDESGSDSVTLYDSLPDNPPVHDTESDSRSASPVSTGDVRGDMHDTESDSGSDDDTRDAMSVPKRVAYDAGCAMKHCSVF